MKDIKRGIRNCEYFLLLMGLSLLLLLVSTGITTGVFYIGIFIGYMIGFFSFVALAEVYASLDSMPQWFSFLGIILGNFKLLFLGLTIVIFYKLGICLKEMVLGTIISQLAIGPAIYLALRKEQENADSKDRKK